LKNQRKQNVGRIKEGKRFDEREEEVKMINETQYLTKRYMNKGGKIETKERKEREEDKGREIMKQRRIKDWG
jgi:hypothetical protein